jgi:hypothetical protein
MNISNGGVKRKKMALFKKYIITLALFLAPVIACTQSGVKQETIDKWVASWGTAQQLDDAGFPNIKLPPNFKMPEQPPPPKPGEPGSNPSIFYVPSDLKDRTARMVIHTSIGGKKVRVNLSNALGHKPLRSVQHI